MWREVRRAVSWHRRLLASGLLAGAMAMALTALSPSPPETVAVVAASRDLAGGTTLSRDQLTQISLPADSVPDGSLRVAEHVVGRVLAAPLRRGEALTDVRLVGRSLVASYGGRLVAAPVRLADAATAALLRPGDVIDLLAASAPELTAEAGPATARLVASAVPVLAVPRNKDSAFGGTGGESGALVVVAVSADAANRLAASAVASRISAVIRASGQ